MTTCKLDSWGEEEKMYITNRYPEPATDFVKTAFYCLGLKRDGAVAKELLGGPE